MQEIMRKTSHILIVASEKKVRDYLCSELSAGAVRVSTADSNKTALSLVSEDPVSMIVCSANFIPGLKEVSAGASFLLVEEPEGINSVAESLELYDFISKASTGAEIRARAAKLLEKRDACQVFKKELTELRAQYEELELRKSEILQSEKLATMGRLVSGMAHEINNPLTAVIGYAQLLIDSGGQDMHRQLGVIRDQAQRCGRIIQDLMLFARNRKPNFLRIKVSDVLETAIHAAKNELALREIVCSLKTLQDEPVILGDAGLLQKVFLNLILNAAHALEERKSDRHIDVLMKLNEKGIEISVKDNGPGIPEENAPLVFEPFFTTKEVGKGAGLGLSLCYGLVNDHGGKIRMESQAGKGALFTVSLPLHREIVEAAEVPVTAAASNTKRGKILIIEDEFFIAEFVSGILKGQGYETAILNDGLRGYEALKSQNYDLVLCDYRIPLMNGMEVFERISLEKGSLRNRFILVTASISFAEADEGALRKKGIFYLPKPFTSNELTRMVETALSFANSTL